MGKVQSYDADSWNEFKRDLLPALFRGTQASSGRYLFRGQSNANYPLQTSFDRQFARETADDRLKLTQELLEMFKSQCRDHDVEDSEAMDDDRFLALAQHYGLPTRLLDWSTSPYVAAFFAFNSAVLAGGIEDRTHVGIWALDTECRIWAGDHGVRILHVPALQNRRLGNQFGRFTVSESHHVSLEDYVAQFPDAECGLTRFVLPATEAWMAIPDLEMMGINAAHLYPDMVGLAQAVLTDLILSTARRHQSTVNAGAR